MKVLVTANDPGGANAVLPVAQELLTEGSELLVVLTGPAREVFERGNVEFVDGEKIEKNALLERVDSFGPELLLSGTSVGSSLDKELLIHTKGSVRSLYVLDAWNSNAQWFSKEANDLEYLPDLICAPDDQAKSDMVAEGIPEEIIRVTGNPYFEHFTDGVTVGGEDKHRVLFVSQPVSEFEGKPYGFDEFDALEGTLDALKSLPEEYYLVIRLHPRDDAHKYDAYVSERVRISSEELVEKDLSDTGLVIGMFSPVLIQATMAGKCAISFEPNLIGKDPLPTNRLEETLHVHDTESLALLLGRYSQNTLQKLSTNEAFKHLNSTARILELVHTR